MRSSSLLFPPVSQLDRCQHQRAENQKRNFGGDEDERELKNVHNLTSLIYFFRMMNRISLSSASFGSAHSQQRTGMRRPVSATVSGLIHTSWPQSEQGFFRAPGPGFGLAGDHAPGDDVIKGIPLRLPLATTFLGHTDLPLLQFQS